MDQPHYYIISGLGADYQAFQRLELPKNHTHLAWISNNPNEGINAYAKRMAEKIHHTNPIIIGLSFGGIVAQEIATIINVQFLILISTVKNHYEKPRYFRLAKSLHLLDLVPVGLFKQSNPLMYWMFSLKTAEEKALLDYFYPISNPRHLKWALNQILDWRGSNFTCDFVHIHSKGDRIFPIKNVQNCIPVSGGHFAVYTHSKEVNAVLEKYF